MLVDDMLHLAVVAVDRHNTVEVVQWRPLNIIVENYQIDSTYVMVAVMRDGWQVAWHVDGRRRYGQ